MGPRASSAPFGVEGGEAFEEAFVEGAHGVFAGGALGRQEIAVGDAEAVERSPQP